MNLLSAVLPGLRDLRVPLTVGALWLAFIYAVSAGSWQKLYWSNDYLQTIFGPISRLPLVYLSGGVAFVAYLVGCVAVGPSTLVTRSISAGGVALAALMRKRLNSRRASGWLPSLLLPALRSNDVSEVNGPVLERIGAAFGKTQVGSGGALSFPLERTIASFPRLALQLWHKSPSQYQEYDRLRAESAFRSGATLPLLCLAVVLGLTLQPLVIPIAIVVAAILLTQANRLEHQSKVLVANALSQDLIQDPLLSGVVEFVNARRIPRDSSEASKISLTTAALWQLGEFDAAQGTLDAIVDRLEYSSYEIDDPGSFSHLVGSADTQITKILRSVGADELIPIFRNQVLAQLDIQLPDTQISSN